MLPPRTDNPLGTFIVKGPAAPSSPILKGGGGAQPPVAIVLSFIEAKAQEIVEEIGTLRHRIELLEERADHITRLEERVNMLQKIADGGFDRATVACQTLLTLMNLSRDGGDLEDLEKAYQVAKEKIEAVLGHG